MSGSRFERRGVPAGTYLVGLLSAMVSVAYEREEDGEEGCVEERWEADKKMLRHEGGRYKYDLEDRSAPPCRMEMLQVGPRSSERIALGGKPIAELAMSWGLISAEYSKVCPGLSCPVWWVRFSFCARCFRKVWPAR